MMIAITETGQGHKLWMLGLSRENVNRLIAGSPIRVSAKTHGKGIPEHLTIAIMFGETERDMQQVLKDAGLIGPATKLNIDPRLK